MVDQPKDGELKDFEQWSKIASCARNLDCGNDQALYTGDPFIYKSATDGYLFLEVPSEECNRRITNRKIDPQTGVIYHMEDSPPPEGDPKLKDRLQDYPGD